jgi:uncharacterized cupredoxin-like copper-binding protein
MAWVWARRRRVLVAVVALVPVAVVTWVGAARHPGAPAPAFRDVNVWLDDFHVRPDTAVVPAGVVRFRIVSDGPSTHEFIVGRSDRAPGKLPLQRDGLTVDEEGPGLKHVEEAEGLDIADRRTLTLTLAPGHYVLFCNMEGHYLGGMHAAITVR